MGDVTLLVKRLSLGAKSQQIEAQAFEYLRLANARLGYRALGNVRIVPSTYMCIACPVLFD